MNVDIERIAITLHGVPIALGNGIAAHLDSALERRLSELKLRTAGSGISQMNLGVIDAPADADAQAISDLIAARLVDWIAREHDAPAPAATSESTGSTAAPGEES
jgi:hypothetical protein